MDNSGCIAVDFRRHGVAHTWSRLFSGSALMPPSSRCAVTRLTEFSSPRRMVNIPPLLLSALRGDQIIVFRVPPLYFGGFSGLCAMRQRRQRDRVVAHQGVGLQSRLQRGQIGERFYCRTGLALCLRGSVKLAQDVGETSRHRQDATGLVLQHQGRALHCRPYAQFA